MTIDRIQATKEKKTCRHILGDTEILDEQKRLVKCKACGDETILNVETFKFLKDMLTMLAQLNVYETKLKSLTKGGK